jgi:hypothetical protein
MSSLRLAWVVLLIWMVLDQWPFRWLAWLWVVVVSLPFVVLVMLGLGLIGCCRAIGMGTARVRAFVGYTAPAVDPLANQDG